MVSNIVLSSQLQRLSFLVMARYPDLVESVLAGGDLLERLQPTEARHPEWVLTVRTADDADLSGGNSVQDGDMWLLVRAGLLYACDAIQESHGVVQAIQNDTAAYWHGMLHRREGDFDNARYWYRRAGIHPTFGGLHAAASPESALMARQANWDPYLFTGECEQQRFGGDQDLAELRKLQRIEFDGLFDYVWRHSFA